MTGAADVRCFSPQVSYIEDRIAALNAAGIQGDRRRRVRASKVSLFNERKAGFLLKVSDADADNVNTAAPGGAAEPGWTLSHSLLSLSPQSGIPIHARRLSHNPPSSKQPHADSDISTSMFQRFHSDVLLRAACH